MDVNQKAKSYIKGLDGLRGIAAILVILGHIELLKKVFGFKNVYDGGGPFYIYLGALAVTFFFVLSGFLITYLLLNEREKNNNISIKNFYLRRVLRIWPVYYLLFIIGFIAFPFIINSNLLLPNHIPKDNYWRSFLFNFLLLPNFVKPSNPIAFQSWSIGVEEQFYIFWPLIIARITSLKKLFIAMVLIIVSIYLLRSAMIVNNFSDYNFQFLVKINQFFGACRFDNMAIGGLLAIFYFKKPHLEINFFSKVIIIISLSILLIKQPAIGFGLDNVIAAIIFALLIALVAYAKNISFLEHKIFKFLGRISYGIYMYHVIGIIIAINIIRYFNRSFNGEGFYNIILYILTIIITILIANVSYIYLEKYFLKFKK
ncbi:acyltransferase [Pedobacter changchengzhani]|uniref:Acyltransferase n=1 Tax=Pedobacter changchengzhani TaxID=2529274 RepID=A0A4R5MPH2_9SPHI|nr:acyltransferase [Pedobacter changchengzhani]TDG37712.1 acyltransferase [Pedobacter changchengzhani]